MTKLKFLVSLLLALGLVACPDDEDEDKKDDYTLKVDSISDIEAGGDFSVDVKVQKDSKTVTEGDGATLEVAIAVTCKAKATTDKDARTEVKPSAKKATKGEVTITGTAHTSWKAEDTCTVKATADGAKEATGTFKIKAAAADTGPENGDEPAFPATVVDGKEFSITNGEDAKISFINTNDENWCDADNNFFFKVADPVEEIDEKHTIDADGDKFFVVGSNCRLMIDGVTAKQAVTAAKV